MTEFIQSLKDFFVIKKAHHAARGTARDEYGLAREWSEKALTPMERAGRRLDAMLLMEEPVIFPGERIVFTRTNPTVFSLFTPEELEALRGRVTLHERGEVCNISVDYTRLLSCGFDAKISELDELSQRFEHAGESRKASYSRMQAQILRSVLMLSDRYRALAHAKGRDDIAAVLENVPRKSPQSFLEALQMLRIIHYTMWLGGNYHNTLGRFDQYMLPYLRNDLNAGRLTMEAAQELVEEFFLTFNRDSDLYFGMQQGDNGQSMVLGGMNADGTDSYNELSELCMKASLALCLIDPKINLRVHKDTPLELYRLGSMLTKQGLGFPQYSNDDVVVPALIAFGYAPQDAYQYVVAACWEFIIPGKGMDIPNINAVSFAQAMHNAVDGKLENCESFEALMDEVKGEIRRQADDCINAAKNVYIFPSPFLSLMMEGCTENARDISNGCVYNNYGFHGTGVATAVDALTAIKRAVYEEGSVSREALLHALRTDFAQDEALRARLRYDMPKMGNNDDAADDIAVELMDAFADALEGKHNERGGIFRPGTGSAMYYLWHAKNMPATADGRRRGENLAANYSPSLFARVQGPISIMQSFAKPHLKRVCNGGPLTLELHDTLFRNDQAIEKVALMVKSFMDLGGHQLQLNAVNREELLDAQKHPDEHRDLIVRVWGWSGYFVELDREYQDHIISRMELSL